MQGCAGALDIATCLAVEEAGGLDVDHEVATVVTRRRRQQHHPADLLVELAGEGPAQRLCRGNQRLVRGVDVPSVREWGQSISGMRRLVRAFRDLPVNLIVTAHETEMRDNAGITWFKPDFPGKLKNQIAGMFSCVWYIYTKAEQEMDGKRKVIVSEQRLLLTGYTEGFVCKTRAGTLPRVVQEPQMADLYSAVTGRSPITGETLPAADDRNSISTGNGTE